MGEGRGSDARSVAQRGVTIAAEPSLGRAAPIEPLPASPAAAAVAELFERHGARVLAYCRSQLRDAVEAEDAAQTTFLLAQRALARGVVPHAEVTWLITIAQNVCLNRVRDANQVRAWEQPRGPEELERLAPPAERERIDIDALKAAVAALPEQQRRAILLREWQGWSYAEIERELGLGKAAVETLIFRGRRALAARLQGRVRALDGLSLASALKGLLGGGGATAAKLGAAAAVVAVVGTGVAYEVRGDDSVTPRPPAAASPAAPESRAVPARRAEVAQAAAADPVEQVETQATRSVSPQRHAPVPAQSRTVAPEPTSGHGAPRAPAPDGPSDDEKPAPSPTKAAAPAAPAAPAPVTETLAAAPAAVDGTVARVVDETVKVVDDTVATVESTVADAGATVASAAGSTATEPTAVAPPALPAAPTLP